MTLYEAYLISTDWTIDSTKAAFALFIFLCFVTGCIGFVHTLFNPKKDIR